MSEEYISAEADWEEITLSYKIKSNEDELLYEIPITVAHPPSKHGYLLGLTCLNAITSETIQQLLDLANEDIEEAEVVE